MSEFLNQVVAKRLSIQENIDWQTSVASELLGWIHSSDPWAESENENA